MTRYRKIVNGLMTFGSAFMFCGYFSYLIKLFIWSEGVLPYIIAFATTLGLPLIFLLDRRGVLEKLFGKFYLALKSVYTFLLCFYFVSFIFMCAYIFVGAEADPMPQDLPSDTVVVVLGAKVEGNGSPGKVLEKRLDTAYEYLRERPELFCIVSGGQGADEPISEARAMKNYLTSRGIPEDRIIIEDKSSNTIENFENTRAILDAIGKSENPIAIITTNFHIPRAEILVNRLGIQNDTYYIHAPDTGKIVLYTILVREYMSYCKLFLFGS